MDEGTREDSRIAGLLFSDIEGSTRLAQRLGIAWAEALERHRSIARVAFAHHGGREIGTEGDSFFVVFSDPLEAVEAAAELQAGLDHAEWQAGDPIRVRIGIHAGPVTAHGSGYVGPEVHRAARIAAGGHGGQVLVSESARAMIGDRLPPGLALRELGRYRLKDFDAAQTIFQLDFAGAAPDFPPVRLAAVALTNLPAQRTSFVGRVRETAELRELVGAHRLVTLVGVGGTGKTRLMLELGQDLGDRNPDGIWLVELAALTEPQLVASEVARILGAPEAPGRTPTDAAIAFLGSKSLLLLLDNCEHLIRAVADLVDRLLTSCPNLVVMASSREALGIPGEAVFQVPSLAIPPGDPAPDAGQRTASGWLDEIIASEAVRLFIDRATVVRPSFSVTSANVVAVVEICRRLDGIPLAIELAAARVNVMSAAEIRSGLDDRFRLLTGGKRTALPRQQTLQALIDWSWQLLSEDDRHFLARLSVFSGGWTLGAAAVVTKSGDRGTNSDGPSDGGQDRGAVVPIVDPMSRLVERSLVQVEHGDPTRYSMLETIRQYARDRLIESGDAGDVRDRHLDFFLALTVDAAALLRGPEMLSALDRLDLEIDNVRAALEWSFGSHLEKALRLSHALGGYWRSRAYGAEAVERSARAVDLLPSLPPPDPGEQRARSILEARVLAAGAFAHALWGHAVAVREWAERALTLGREVGDPDVLIETLTTRAMVAAFAGEYAVLPRLQAETSELAAANGDWWTVAMLEAGAVLPDVARGDLASAETRVGKATAAAERTGNPFAIAMATLSHGRLSGSLGRTDEARQWYGQAIRAYEQMGDRLFALAARSDLGNALRLGGELDEAEALYRETIRSWQYVGNLGAVANQLERIGFIAIARREAIRGANLLGAAEALRENAEAPMPINELEEYRTPLAELRAMIDADALEAAWASGRRLTPDVAVSLARSGT